VVKSLQTRYLDGVVRAALIVLGALPLVALVLQSVSPGSGAVHALEAWFSLQCHQDPSRTLRIAGHLFPVCARCTGIYAGLALGALLPGRVSSTPVLVALGAGVVLLGLDVATEAAGLRVPGLAARVVTGLALSAPAALLASRAAEGPSRVNARM